MSILSDYQRHVSEPLEASLRATIAALRARVAELEAKPAGVEITEEMVERAALALQKLRLERLKKLWDTKGSSLLTDEPSGMRDDARAALTAALSGGSDAKAD